jgi:hypothetical protein
MLFVVTRTLFCCGDETTRRREKTAGNTKKESSLARPNKNSNEEIYIYTIFRPRKSVTRSCERLIIILNMFRGIVYKTKMGETIATKIGRRVLVQLGLD